MSASFWSVPDAKAKLSEILRRARKGERQVIGAHDPCVVLSMTEYDALQRKANPSDLGQWLVAHVPKVEFEPPSRSGGRKNAFEED